MNNDLNLPKNNGFTFKQFFVAHDKSPMKVTTDSVLLGAWAPTEAHPKSVLDIGTGCGVIALMLAQRMAHIDCQIDAIEIDQQAAKQCIENSYQAPFNNINVINGDVIEYAKTHAKHYDLIVSNPPYFPAAVACRDEARHHARYTSLLDHNQLLSVAENMLTEDGQFCVVLPWGILNEFIHLAQDNSWHPKYITHIQYTADKAFSLALLSLVRYSCLREQTQLCMRNADNSYTPEFTHLLKDFYLRF